MYQKLNFFTPMFVILQFIVESLTFENQPNMYMIGFVSMGWRQSKSIGVPVGSSSDLCCMYFSYFSCRKGTKLNSCETQNVLQSR